LRTCGAEPPCTRQTLPPCIAMALHGAPRDVLALHCNLANYMAGHRAAIWGFMGRAFHGSIFSGRSPACAP
jgi:hypothetical protein